MKKCPRCMITEENDLTRFCKHCNTELFFLDRFPDKDSASEKNIKKVNMKPIKIIVDIAMLVFVVLSLLRWSGDPTFHIVVGSIFATLFIIHFLINAKTFISMSKKFGKIKAFMKLQYVVNVVLIILWSCVVIFGIIAAYFYLNSDLPPFKIGRLHGVLGRIGCGFIAIHTIQHIKHIRSYFKIKKRSL